MVNTEHTPNPDTLKFLPGKVASNSGSFEVTRKDKTNNELIQNLLSINGVEGIFLGNDFISIYKNEIKEINAKKDLKVVDLTGAGDLFASGYLHGFINDFSQKECLTKATEMSSKIIQQIGARF